MSFEGNETKNFEYLDDLITSSTGEIVLDCNIILSSSERNNYKNGIAIEKDNLVLDGNNHYIDSNGKTRIFEILGDNVTIKNLNFKNGSDKKGAAINNKSNNASLVNCNFEDNSSRLHGGVIYNGGESLSLEECIFKNNSARGHGGAIYNDEGSLIIKDCDFNNNSARKYGGVIFNNSSLDIKNCKFLNNASKSHGGVVYNDNGDLKFEECCFDNNSSEKYGGVVYNGQGSINFNKSKFAGNNAKSYGGVVYNEGVLQFNNCDFTDNTAMKLGSVLWTNAISSILASKFVDNNSNQKSCIYQEFQDSNLNISNSSFEYKVLKELNIIEIEMGYGLLENVSFEVLEKPVEGNLFYNKDGEVTINKLRVDESYQNCIYNDNILKIKNNKNLEKIIVEGRNSQIKYDLDKLSEDWKGFDYLNSLICEDTNRITLDCDIIMHDSEKDFYEGGIELSRDDLTIDGKGHIIDAKGFSRIFHILGNDICLKNIIFKNGKYFYNYLNTELEGGGAINILHDTSVKIVNCEFIGNNSRNSAGAICNRGKLTIEGETKFLNNVSKKNSGAITNYGAELVLKGKCLFDKNSAELDGGAIYNTGYLSITDGCEFSYNESKDKGGAIFNSSKFVLATSIFRNNSSKDGGSIFTKYKYELTFEGCLFEKNFSGSGGAISNNGKLLVEKCDFNDNDANYKGGAISIEFDSILNIKKCKFNENSCKLGFGGAICSTMSDLIIEAETKFEKNLSGGGGAIFYSGSRMRISDTTFINNIAKQASQNEINGGGAIFTKGVANRLLSIENCVFNVNKSAIHGGAVYVGGESYVGFTGCQFENNESLKNGNSIFNDGVVNLNDLNNIKDKIVNNGKIYLKMDNIEDMIINTGNGIINK